MTDVQDRHAPAVLANQLRLATGWDRPCLGYLLVAQPDDGAAGALGAVQDMLLDLEPSLLPLPAAALHCTAAFLIPVFQQCAEPKDEIWRRHASAWSGAIAAAARACHWPLRLYFRQLIMTDAAIIAVAEQPNAISDLRRALAPALDLPWPISTGDLVHVTLARYRAPLADPAAMLHLVQDTRLAADTELTELLLVRETVFPMLAFQTLHRFGPGGPPPGLLPSAAWPASTPTSPGLSTG